MTVLPDSLQILLTGVQFQLFLFDDFPLHSVFAGHVLDIGRITVHYAVYNRPTYRFLTYVPSSYILCIIISMAVHP
jgi:hypothetical protein